MTTLGKTRTLRGASISPGLGQGIIQVNRGLQGPLDGPGAIAQEDIEAEFARLDFATASITDDLIVLATRVEKEIDSKLSEVFAVHQLMLNDASLKQELRKEIVDNLVHASCAVKTVFLRWEHRFLAMESQIARDKGDDMRDISIRLHNALAGITVHPLDGVADDCVLVTSRLLPSDTIFLANHAIAAVLLEYGSSGSHAALFARQMGLPCIARIPDLMKSIADGDLALVDADSGLVTIQPRQDQQRRFRTKIAKKQYRFRVAQEQAHNPAVTVDGVRIAVLANVGTAVETEKAIDNGAEGIGLYRTEQVYLGRVTPPNCDELFREMSLTLAAAKGLSVCVRLLDIGADKPLPFLGFLAESNPALGRRGIRLLREYPSLLETQLRAILMLTSAFNVSVLIPMVTLPRDAAIVRELLIKLCAELEIAPIPRLGAMIETPAAALSARKFLKFVDFLSFGTNDLTQYTFASDRNNAAIEQYFNHASPIIFRLLQLVHADVPSLPLSICGELAGQSEHIPKLLACGIRSFSVAAPVIPFIKAAIRYSTCQKDHLSGKI